ncbi:uncharacterized protein LOC143025224 [Oratosquilla oratoria]|uniref:uncharacterized protein LOC143025224 n=1 Tax=Oratosquilla oratoria TaxID=337810 RepID=UPI003F774086
MEFRSILHIFSALIVLGTCLVINCESRALITGLSEAIDVTDDATHQASNGEFLSKLFANRFRREAAGFPSAGDPAAPRPCFGPKFFNCKDFPHLCRSFASTMCSETEFLTVTI